jgi:multidrug efflux pump subunit AcrB
MNTPQKLSLSAVAIRQHIATLVLTVTVVVLGWFFLTQLRVDLLPSITYPRINVNIDAPGISPEVAVDEITRPLEAALSATEGVVQVYSQTREGRISVELYFRPGANIDQALNDATATLNRARAGLPDTIGQPRISKSDPSQTPIYEFALQSTNLDETQLRVFADQDLGRELALVPGVASVSISGGLTEEVQVNMDFDRLRGAGIALDEVLNALRQRNVDISGGRILGKDAEPLTRVVGRFSNAQEISDLSFPIKNAVGTTAQGRVYLRDFATVVDGTTKQRLLVFLNGQPALKVSIQKQPEANTIEVVDGLIAKIAELKTTKFIPEEMVLLPTANDAIFIRNSLSDLTMAGVSGSILAAIAVFFFLGSLRQTLIITLTIPLCTLAAFILMKLFNLSLNVFSMGGLALGIGQAIDTSVVFLENIAVGLGKNPGSNLSPEACIEQSIVSAQEVESSVLASSAANLVSVVPFLLVGGFFSLLFNELILTITFATAASLLVALTVVPALTARLLAIPWSSGAGNLWLVRKFQSQFLSATNSYGNFLGYILRWRVVVLISAILFLGGSSALMLTQIRQEVLPPINTGQANLFAQFPPGTTLATNRQVMELVNEIVLKQPETDYAFSTVGGFIFSGTNSNNVLRSSVNITLKPGSNVRNFVRQVTAELDKLNLVGIRLRLVPGQVRGIVLNNSPVRGAELDVILASSDSQKLVQAGTQLLAALDEQVKSARFRPSADARQTEIQIKPDWERASRFGLSTRQIGDAVAAAVQGIVPIQLQREQRLVDVRVQLQELSLQQASQLGQLPISSSGSQIIRLGDVAKVGEGRAPGEVQRINQQEVFVIAGNLAEGKTLGEALIEVNQVLGTLELPPGVKILQSSAQETNNQLQNALKLLGALAAFLVFVVMAVQYNSLIDPLVIMLTVPLALAGGLFGLYVTGTAIGATVLIGVVLLIGIVVNNAIIMVELANEIYGVTGCDRSIAILQAAPQRLRPICITSITTVLGLFPLALGLGEGSEFLQPLGVVVFFGLSLATLLTLFIIPCFYTLLHDLFAGKLAFGRMGVSRSKS